MEYREDIIKMYKSGCSIDYIINDIYKRVKKNTRIINLSQKKIILIEDRTKRSDIKKLVYRVIYDFVI